MERVGSEKVGDVWRYEEALCWWMHFSLIRSRLDLVQTWGSMEEALRHPSKLSLCDGPLQTEGMRRYIVGRVIGIVSDVEPELSAFDFRRMLPASVLADAALKPKRARRARRG